MSEDQIFDTDTKYKAVDFVETYTGRAFWPLDPKVEDICIIDIAHHLSGQPRYSGASWYVTAQHCCLLADFVQKRGGTPLDCLQILMHDAPEAYLVDMTRPVKQHMPEFRKWDKNINVKIREWLGLADIPIPEWQDEIDSRIIVDERAQLLSDSGLDWGHNLKPLGIHISMWERPVAEEQFLMRYATFAKAHFGKHQYLRASWGIPTTCAVKEFPFLTKGSDIEPLGDPEPKIVTDLVEVDIRGGVGRVAMRSPNGIMIRDTEAGRFPRPAYRWVRGSFELAPDTEKTEMGVH